MSDAPAGLTPATYVEPEYLTATAPFQVFAGDFLRIEGDAVLRADANSANAVACNSSAPGESFKWLPWSLEADPA